MATMNERAAEWDIKLKGDGEKIDDIVLNATSWLGSLSWGREERLEI